MDWSALLDITVEHLGSPALWGLVVLVGLLINLYGQVIVPYLRDIPPLEAMRTEYRSRPKLFVTSISIAFVFPFLVSLFSSVTTSYATRHVVERANFPDEKPDPVFRVDLDGHFVDMGRSTRELLEAHPADSARTLLGPKVWNDVVRAHHDGVGLADDTAIRYGGDWYLVAFSSSSNGKLINVYLARLHNTPDSICQPARR